MPSGLTATLPNDLALNAAVLYHGASIAGSTVSGTKVSVTKGGIDFDPGIKDREIEFDGKRSTIAGLEYPIEYDAHIKGKIIQLGADQIALLLPGSAADTAGSVTTYTPKAADTLYEVGDYLEDVMAVWSRGDGGLFVVQFPLARVMKWKVDSKDKQEAEIDLDLKAVLSLDAAVTDTGTAPFQILDVAA